MTRSNARELAAHLIYELDYTDETPEQAIESRMERGYYDALAGENEVYAERPVSYTHLTLPTILLV